MVGAVALLIADAAEGRSLLTYLGFLTSKETEKQRSYNHLEEKQEETCTGIVKLTFMLALPFYKLKN